MQLSSTLSLRGLADEIAGSAVRRGGERVQRAWLPPLAAVLVASLFALVAATHGREFVTAVDRALHAGWSLVVLGALLEALSLAGYVLLMHRVVASASPDLRLRDSYDITLAGTVATRLLPTAGLGGAAVTVWALRARGVRPRELGERLLAFLLLLYAVYMAALLFAGALVALDVVQVHRGQGLGLLGAALAAAIAGGVLSLLALPSLASRLARRIPAARRLEDQLPTLQAALRRAWLEVRKPNAALIGAVAWWTFDIGVLAAMLHAFGADLPLVAIVLAYFLGTMFNVLPLPGSLSGGLIGVLIALGTPAAPAIAAVLAYRSVAVWLPAASGIPSLARLRASVSRWRAETAAA
jgi:uncharacterized membrane protein YbhN (UPF0104 family)